MLPVPVPVLVKAALPAVPVVNRLPGVRRGGSELPDLTLERDDVAVDPARLAAYADLCGFAHADVLPPTYPHLLAFGLHLQLMTSASFPFPAIGTVHLANSITQQRPIAPTERLQIGVRAERLRPHPKGTAFDLVTRVRVGGEPVWAGTSTFLRRGPGQPDAPAGPTFPAAPPSGEIWRLPADLGRRYAAVSGDRNPIHLYPVTARAFGFPRQIVHGMWSLARCVAALGDLPGGALTVAAAFKRPILLPGEVTFGSRPLDSGDQEDTGDAGSAGHAFSLSALDGSPHLAGAATWPPA